MAGTGARLPQGPSRTSETFQISVMLGEEHYVGIKALSVRLGINMKTLIKLMIDEGTRNPGPLQAALAIKQDTTE